MVYTELVFYSSLIICVALGESYRIIEDPETRRNYGTGVGILITCVVCGSSVLHSILMVWGNIIIIKCCNKLYIHQLSLAYTWLYLIYIYYRDDGQDYVFWVHQVVALRLVGLAFELALAEKSQNEPPKILGNLKIPVSQELLNKTIPKLSTTLLMNNDLPRKLQDPNAVDIISYAYFYTGLHKGPYYRWKTFNEHFDVPSSKLSNYRAVTEQKLKKAFLIAAVYIVLCLNFPVEIYYDEDFYFERGTDYRYLYNIPQLLKYVLRYQVVLLLCASVCTEAGFGVYPARTQPLPGHGPSAKFSVLRISKPTSDDSLHYSFGMLKSFDNEKLLVGPRMTDTLRGWDMSVRYWFWTFTYRDLVQANKDVRNAVSFLAWSVWCSPTFQQLLICSTLWVHVHLEHEYDHLYAPDDSMKLPWDIGFSIMRVFCLTYLTPCLILDEVGLVFRYYNSIYWVYHAVLFLLILGALGVHKYRIMARRRAAETEM